jgi:heat shock protein HslJ
MSHMLWGAGFLFAVLSTNGAPASCGVSSVTDVKELQGKWVLVSINSEAIATESDIYFKIDGKTISGFDGCNTFGGPLDAPDRMRMTQRECSSDTPRLPLDLSNPRRQLESSKLEGDTLVVDVADGKARFRRQPPG